MPAPLAYHPLDDLGLTWSFARQSESIDVPAEPLDNGLTPQQDAAIVALLKRRTILKVAEDVGVSRTTIFNWLNNPTFAKAYAAARAQLVDHAVAQIQKSTAEAVRTLRRNLKSVNGQVSNVAARALIEHALRALETQELRDRVAELERRIEEMRAAGADQHGGEMLRDDEED